MQSMPRAVRVAFAIGFVIAVAMILTILGAAPARAQNLDEPTMLVAAPEMVGYYQRTVILAVPVGDEHVGVVLNRPLGKTTLADLFPDHAPSKAVPGVVHVGGPELRSAIFAMVYAAASPGESSLMLMPGLWLVGGAADVDRIIESRPKDARFYTGFVGWRAGELEEDLRKGFFTLHPVDKSLLFLPDTTHLHEQLVPKKGRVQT